MKKLVILFILFTVLNLNTFADNDKQEEVEIYEYEYVFEPAPVTPETDKFNWWWLLLLLLPLFFLLWPKKIHKQHKTAPSVKPASESALKRPAAGEPKYYRLTEEEIRNLAYKLFEERHHQDGCDETDWHNAISQLSAKYEAQGYIVLWP